jgi:hypothetical protein
MPRSLSCKLSKWPETQIDRYIDLHFFVETIVEYKVVCHSDSMWLHWMPLSIIVVAHVTFERITSRFHM